jgi:uncharacterized protein YeaO (DUF488 family)
MAIRVVRLGSPRAKGEGVRLGTVRRLPRGVRKTEYASGNWFDAWLPELSPSADLVTWALSEPWTDARWRRFERGYRREMRAPATRHLIDSLVALSKHTDLAVGCYCESPARCHRSILAALLGEAGAEVTVVGETESR